MAPQTWATLAEEALMKASLPDFMRRQAEGKLHLFWGPFFLKFFGAFCMEAKLNLPLPTDRNAHKLTVEERTMLGDAIQKKEQQVRSWLRYNAGKIGKATAGARRASATLKALFKSGVSKNRRRHHPIEIFQRRNRDLVKKALSEAGYDTSTKDIKPEELEHEENEEDDEEDDEDTPLTPSKPKSVRSLRFAMRKRVTAELWAKALEEERTAVAAEMAKESQELQQGIDALNTVYADVHKATYNTSGWVGMTILGGPNPRYGGELALKIVCLGETRTGNTYEDVCVDFDKNVTQTFKAFLRQCFTKKTKQKKKKTPSAVIVQDEDVAAVSPGSETPEAGSPESGVTSESVATPEGPQDLFANSLALEPQESSRWPDGMGPPLSPEEAAALARMERGGASGEGATMAIDPQLTALSVPRSPSLPPSSSPMPLPPARPQPRAAYSGAGHGNAANTVTIPAPTVRVGGYNFPVAVALETSAYRPSTLFQAFTPGRRSVPPTTLHTASPTPLTPCTGSGLALNASSEPTTEPATRAPVLSQSRPSTEPVARARVLPQSCPSTEPGAHAPVLPQSRPATEGAAPPVAPTATPALVVPRSRPATKPSAAKAKTKAGAAAKEVAAKAAKKVEVKRTAVRGTRVVVAESAESAEGAPPGPKKRGRPKKVVAEEGETMLADVTNAAAEGPTFSITNNNRQGARRAEEEEKARVAAEAEAEKQAARGWVRTTQNGHDCVVLTSGRARKPTMFHDGTVVQREVKGRRNPHAAIEEDLVARARKGKGKAAEPSGKKRKVAEDATTTAPKSKRRKV
ncbi:hypothetical protein DFH07DRAFT_951774 [Mycena maculata]|uniref:Uncharacterized protein n=1 Tax=Mycena maculata TaxID=230809 RepID=A0AAD7K6J0_9AGAR|nr:hypothetical protein DFH07DRAFT_951774 [Mycena maculata]